MPRDYAKEQKASREKRKLNPDSVRKFERERRKKRYDTDPFFRMSICLRSRLQLALRRQEKAERSASAMSLVGCPMVWLEAHLESQFVPGMTWANYGPVWHIDHIRPCSSFNLKASEQQQICFHWTNLQPLFAFENLSKGGR